MTISIKPLYSLIPLILLPFAISAQQSETGKLTIDVNLPDPFYIVVNDQLTEAQKISDGGSITLEPGTYQLTLISGYTDDYHFEIEIEPGDDLRYEHRFEVFHIDQESTFRELEDWVNLVIQTDKESEIFVDGESKGFQQAYLLVNPGMHVVESRHPTLGSLKKKVLIEYAETEEVYRYNQLQSSISPSIFLLPGAGYIITKQQDKTILTYLSMGVLFGSYISLDQKILYSSRVYDEDQLKNLQRASLIGLGVVYLVTTIDGMRKPRQGYPGDPIEFELGQASVGGHLFPTAGFKVKLGR
jgi:hypothetical protein